MSDLGELQQAPARTHRPSGRAAKMSLSMLPFASLISRATGLRLMSELQRGPGPGPGPLGRLAGPESDSDSGSKRRCPAGAAGAAESLAPDRSTVGHGVPGTSLSGAGVPARPARGPGRAVGRLQQRRSQPSLGPMAASQLQRRQVELSLCRLRDILLCEMRLVQRSTGHSVMVEPLVRDSLPAHL
jgi:hypothetical protein